MPSLSSCFQVSAVKFRDIWVTTTPNIKVQTYDHPISKCCPTHHPHFLVYNQTQATRKRSQTKTTLRIDSSRTDIFQCSETTTKTQKYKPFVHNMILMQLISIAYMYIAIQYLVLLNFIYLTTSIGFFTSKRKLSILLKNFVHHALPCSTN